MCVHTHTVTTLLPVTLDHSFDKMAVTLRDAGWS